MSHIICLKMAHIHVVFKTYNLMKMATLEEEKARQTAFQFCVQTVMNLTKMIHSSICSGISRSSVFKWHGQFRDGWTESTQHGGKPFMSICKVLFADETFSGQREVHVSDSTGRYIVYGSVTCFKNWYKHRFCIAHNRAYLYKD